MGRHDFDGRIAVVTGAAQGIGAAVAEHLASRGARVAAVDLDASVRDAAAALPGASHLAIQRDLRDPDAARDIVAEVLQRCGQLDILVNSAGIVHLAPALELDLRQWEQTLQVNLTGSFLMAQAAGRPMTERGYGRIVNLASQASVIALDQHVAYCASKAAIVGMTRVLAMEWARAGVTVNTVSPTVVETELGKKAWSGAAGERMRDLIPTGRFARPEEVGSLVGYLAGEDAAMVTGENILIDGGYSAV